MIPLEYALAVVVIVSPCDMPQSPVPCALSSIQSVALSMELLDPRESAYVFTIQQDSYQDIRMVHSRYKTLHDAPPVCDSVRLPDRDTITNVIAANRRLKQHLKDRSNLDHAAWLFDAIAECDEAYAVWDLARDAHYTWYYVSVRRKALLDLRNAIGPAMYYAGFLPSPLPVWPHRRID